MNKTGTSTQSEQTGGNFNTWPLSVLGRQHIYRTVAANLAFKCGFFDAKVSRLGECRSCMRAAIFFIVSAQYH